MANKKKVVKVDDIVVIYQSGMPSVLTRVTSIVADLHKRDFWVVGFVRSLDSLPMPFEWIWKLDSDHLAGEEFTIGGISYSLHILASAKQEDKTEVKVETETIQSKSNILF